MYASAGRAYDAWARDGFDVEALKKELTALETEFNTNITNADVTVYFTADELNGAPDFLLSQARTHDQIESARLSIMYSSIDWLTICVNDRPTRSSGADLAVECWRWGVV